ARSAGVGQRSIHAVQDGATRATGVCWLIVSETRTPHGVVDSARQGRSRAWASQCAAIAARRGPTSAGGGGCTAPVCRVLRAWSACHGGPTRHPTYRVG